MISARELNRLNDRLGEELGRNIKGEPKYSWRWSEDLFHEMRIPNQWEYQGDPRTGLIQAIPVYKKRRMAWHLDKQWVLCLRCDPLAESEWRARFGDRVLWPKNGYYFPLNVELEPGVQPDMQTTMCAIGLFRDQAKKTRVDLEDEAAKSEEYRERSNRNRIRDQLIDRCTAFANVPGDRGGHVELQIGKDSAMASSDVFETTESINR